MGAVAEVDAGFALATDQASEPAPRLRHPMSNRYLSESL